MRRIAAASTARGFGAPAEKSEAPVTQAYRTRKSFAVVHFEPAVEAVHKGRIVFLPEGAELHVVGSSCLGECFEVLCEKQLYNIFKADLLGVWSTPIRTRPLRTNTVQSMAAIGACA